MMAMFFHMCLLLFLPQTFFQNVHVFLAEPLSSDSLLALPPPWKGFPDCSTDKESSCNAGDLGLIPGLGRFPGEGIGYPLQYSWVSLVNSEGKESACWWASRLLPCPGYDKQCCNEHWGVHVSFRSGFLGVYAQKWDSWVIWKFYFQFFKKSPHCFP